MSALRRNMLFKSASDGMADRRRGRRAGSGNDCGFAARRTNRSEAGLRELDVEGC